MSRAVSRRAVPRRAVPRRAVPRRAASCRSERGTSLLEVLITVTLAVALIGSLLDVFDSFVKAESRQEGSIQVRERLAQALAEADRDLRAAAPIHPPASPSGATTAVTVGVPNGSGGLRTIRYRRDDTAHTVLREVLSTPAGPVTSTRIVLSGAGTGEVLVRYFGVDGTELVPGPATPADLANCTMRLRITVGASPGAGRPDVVVSTEVALRNRVPEDVPC